MAKPTDMEILEVALEIEHLPFRTPLKFGGRSVTDYEILNVTVHARNRAGREATGIGSMPLGNVWAWPTSLSGTRTADAMREMTRRLVADAQRTTGFEHAIDHGWALMDRFETLAGEIEREQDLGEPIPRLAILVAASPVDAAIHDAFGKVNGVNAFDALSSEFMNHDLGHYLDERFAGEFLDAYTLRQPKDRMPLYHLVGALDPLTPADVSKPIGDGLPETLGDWILAEGLTHLKIKLSGDDPAWDVERVASVERVAEEAQSKRGCQRWFYSLDFNERCADVDRLLEFLARAREVAPAALDRVQYLEQPTHRDLKSHPEQKMHEAAKIKPVVIDESLVDFETLELSREMGYSGVAFKACKGQTETLLMAAAAQKFEMFRCVQDLTCPGASFLHSAEIAARIPGVAAIEGNGRQYCPAGNAGWTERYPGMFCITDGTVATGSLTAPGLGHA